MSDENLANSEGATDSPYDVLLWYDAGEVASKGRTAELFKRLAASYMAERDTLRLEVTQLEAGMSANKNEIANLRHQMEASKRSWVLNAGLTLIATVLVGWGVNVVSTGPATQLGWFLLTAGAVVHVINIGINASQLSLRKEA